MSSRAKAVILGTAVLVAMVGYFGVSIARHGFSAKEKPSRLEEFLARHARKIATPADAKALRNPYPVTSKSLEAGRDHWVDHCATCHALDGTGNTDIGRNLYPEAPDMRDAATQELSDGELYYIISHGVRFTGMPAWGGEHNPEETWQLVSFIRHLPQLTPEELKAMQQTGTEEKSGGQAEAVRPDTHTDRPGTKPHEHHH